MEKQNFYQGQSVAPEHLNKLQTYADQGQANLIASLLGYGVVNGFEVSIIEGHIVGVTAGLAFNLAGERLVLTEGQQVNLAQYIPNVGEKTIKLGIVLDFIKTDPATDSMGNIEHTKWEPSVRFITRETLVENEYELAEIKINPISVVEIKTTAVEFQNLQKQISKTHAFSTEITSAKTIANINGDVININKKSFADTIRDMTYPVKSTYTQYPNDTTGFFDETETPLKLFGGDWELVATKIFNNVPTEHTNEFGTSFIYPDGRLEFVSIVQGIPHNTTITFPVPYIDIPFVGGHWVNKTKGGTTIFIEIGNPQLAIRDITISNCKIEITNTNTDNGAITAIGYWKTPIDSITADEEKNYVKIWKRI